MFPCTEEHNWYYAQHTASKEDNIVQVLHQIHSSRGKMLLEIQSF